MAQQIETKNMKGAKMMGFIKICDQYPRRFNFGHFFIISTCPGGDDKNLGESFPWEHE